MLDWREVVFEDERWLCARNWSAAPPSLISSPKCRKGASVCAQLHSVLIKSLLHRYQLGKQLTLESAAQLVKAIGPRTQRQCSIFCSRPPSRQPTTWSPSWTFWIRWHRSCRWNCKPRARCNHRRATIPPVPWSWPGLVFWCNWKPNTSLCG